MKTHKEVMFLALIVSLSIQLQSTAQATENHSCWIKRVEAREGKLYISFLPDYRRRAFVTDEVQERKSTTSSTAASDDLIMWENEKATISDGLHSGCTITAEKHEGRLGVQVRAYVSLPGIPASEKTEFIAAARSEEAQQPK